MNALHPKPETGPPGVYRAPPWLPGGHAQTIYPVLFRRAIRAFRRERWETPDGDFIDLDWNAAGGFAENGQSPLVVLFHGLEGSSRSHYAQALMQTLDEVGWAGVVAHFRGCSGEPNRLPRAYHSGDSDEADWVLRRLKQLHPQRPLYAAGVSLGGNVLLKWLGERGDDAAKMVDGAAAVSAPLDLTVCGHHLSRGFNRIYSLHFLLSLKAASAAKLERFPGLFDRQRLRAATTLYDFDDVVTGPLHGFAGADDYWRRASSKPWLGGIRVPTLILNALNDPFLPREALPLRHQVAPSVTCDFPDQGGHVGFMTGPFPGHTEWLPQRLLSFFRHGR